VTRPAQQTQQQTGVPPIIRQQAAPAFMQAATQSQQPWIIASQALSPLVQVTTHPSRVISHLQAAIVMLQQQTVIPFIVQQTLHIPPAVIWQRFCIIARAVGSSQTQVTFIPPDTFSTFMAQRGTMTMFGAIIPVPAGTGGPPIPMPIPGIIPAIPLAGRSIIIVPVIRIPPSGAERSCGGRSRRAWGRPGSPGNSENPKKSAGRTCPGFGGGVRLGKIMTKFMILLDCPPPPGSVEDGPTRFEAVSCSSIASGNT
jgi:hypothetical protein